MSLEEKVLFKVLQEISRGGTGGQAAPDRAYLDALQTVGYIKIEWDTTLTAFGQSRLTQFHNEQWK